MAKEFRQGQKAREQMKTGLDKLANIVKTTLGPRGRNIVIEKQFGEPDIIQDGVTVARAIDFKDKYENIGAGLAKAASIKTNDEAGDGTTTAIILAQEMVAQGMKYAELGVSSQGIRRGMKYAINLIKRKLKKDSIEIASEKQTEQIATISAKNENIGKIVSSVMNKVGKTGVVSVEPSDINTIEHELVEGFRFNSGFISPYMITNRAKLTATIDEPYILVTDKSLTDIQSLLSILEKVAQEGGRRELVIIAGDLGGDALATLVVNTAQGKFRTLAIKAPEYGEKQSEALHDIAIRTGALLVSKNTGIELADVVLSSLGKARKIESTKDFTTIIQGQGEEEKVKQNIESLEQQLKEEKQDSLKERLRERIGRLSGVVALIKVGANSEVEQKELELRVEDALSATQAALEEGISIGGGLALINSLEIFEDYKGEIDKMTEDEIKGISIIKQAITKPFLQIAENSGQNGEVILKEIERAQRYDREEKPENIGYNAETDTYVDMFQAGIIDPTKVVRSALENAGSIAEMFLSTEAIIVEEKEEKPII